MIATMEKNRRPRGRPKSPDPKRRKPRIVIHDDQEIMDAVGKFCRMQEIQPSESAVWRAAIRRFLEAHGLWPPDVTSQAEK
jgi:hypothetical protein